MTDLLERQRDEILRLRERVRQLEELLVPSTIDVPIAWRLSPQEETVYRCLAARGEASKEQLMAALFSARPNDAPAMKILDVHICRLRRKIKQDGMSIDVRYGRGWALVHAEREAA